MLKKGSACAAYSPLSLPKDLPKKSSCRFCTHYSAALGGCELRDELPPEEE